MMKTLRKIAIIAIAFACVGLAACANEKSNGNIDARVDNTTTTTVVATTEDKEKTEATTTTTTTTVDTTTEPETKTTTADTTAEPETETKTDTTTQKVKTPNAVTTTTEVTEEPDNSDGMYTLEEGFRRKVEELSGQKVVSIKNTEGIIEATLENSELALLIINSDFLQDANALYSIDNFKKFEGFEMNGYSLVIELG